MCTCSTVQPMMLYSCLLLCLWKFLTFFCSDPLCRFPCDSQRWRVWELRNRWPVTGGAGSPCTPPWHLPSPSSAQPSHCWVPPPPIRAPRGSTARGATLTAPTGRPAGSGNRLEPQCGEVYGDEWDCSSWCYLWYHHHRCRCQQQQWWHVERYGEEQSEPTLSFVTVFRVNFEIRIKRHTPTHTHARARACTHRHPCTLSLFHAPLSLSHPSPPPQLWYPTRIT